MLSHIPSVLHLVLVLGDIRQMAELVSVSLTETKKRDFEKNTKISWVAIFTKVDLSRVKLCMYVS